MIIPVGVSPDQALYLLTEWNGKLDRQAMARRDRLAAGPLGCSRPWGWWARCVHDPRSAPAALQDRVVAFNQVLMLGFAVLAWPRLPGRFRPLSMPRNPPRVHPSPRGSGSPASDQGWSAAVHVGGEVAKAGGTCPAPRFWARHRGPQNPAMTWASSSAWFLRLPGDVNQARASRTACDENPDIKEMRGVGELEEVF